MTLLKLRPEQQRQLFLIASGVSTAGSFAGITAKGWILMKGGVDPFVLALNFAALSLPTLLVSGPAGVRTDRVGCERVQVQAQWALLAASGLGALAIPLLEGTAQVLLLLCSTLLVGIAGTYELTSRNKYCSILVEEPDKLAGYLTSFSVVCSTWASWWARRSAGCCWRPLARPGPWVLMRPAICCQSPV